LQTIQKFKKEITKEVEINYLLSLPKSYIPTEKKKWPLIMFFHGMGEMGNNVLKLKAEGIPKLADHKDLPIIIFSPQCAVGTDWHNLSAELRALLLEIIKNYNADTSRIYLTGLSAGGTGTWKTAIAYPKAFAAIAPICGGLADIYAENGTALEGIEKIIKIPVWVFHGTHDDVAPLAESVLAVEKLKALGGNVKATYYPGVGHDCWTETYDNPEFYEWLLSNVNDEFEL